MNKHIKMIGDRYGKVTVVGELESKIDSNGRNKRMFLCKCDCGNTYVTDMGSLRKGSSKSCGCSRKKIDLTGKTFGKLTVLHEADQHITSGGRKIRTWKCICECGNEVIVTDYNLKTGHSKSCGCAYKADYIGKTFGSLTVIAFHHINRNKENVWLCRCLCGKEVTRSSGCLLTRQNPSCGCGGTNIQIDGEIWVDCIDFDGYEVSDHSRVRKKSTGRIVKQKKDNNGYLLVNMYINGEIFEERVHRLVAKAFIPNPLGKNEVNHIDGNKSNCSIENLEWCTRLENQRHAVTTGLVKRKIVYYRYVELEKQGLAKVDYELARQREYKGWSIDSAIMTEKGGRRNAYEQHF